MTDKSILTIETAVNGYIVSIPKHESAYEEKMEKLADIFKNFTEQLNEGDDILKKIVRESEQQEKNEMFGTYIFSSFDAVIVFLKVWDKKNIDAKV